MHLRAHLSGQETCCLDISFCHLSSASGCASSGARYVTFGQRNGNNVYLFCRAMYSTAICGQTVCARSDLGRPTFQSDCFLTHVFCTAVLILDFDNIHRFCIVASILCLKQILDCVHIVPTVIGYVNILLKSIVSRKSKRYVLFCCIFVHLYVFDM